jgi:Thioredoxin
LAPTWEKLAKDWEGHEIGLVAEVDCAVAETLCSDMQIQGYPTLFYGDASAPETYAGDLEYEALAEFAKETLSKPMCSVYNTDVCSDEEKLVIAELEAKSLTDLEASLEEVEKAAQVEMAAFDELVEKLQAQYEAESAAYTAKVEEIRSKSNYQLVKAVVNKKKEAVDDRSEL